MFNLKIGLVHLIQAIVLFVIVNYSFKIYLIARFFDKAPNGGFTVSTSLLWNVPIAVVAPVFLLIAAFFHFFVASPFYVRRYEDNIKKGINPMRWIEYSFSSSLMLVALLMMAGIIELSSVVFVFTLNWLMNMLGLMM